MKISEARKRARSWPEGSEARAVLLNAVGELERQEGKKIAEMEGWLDREWSWLEGHVDDGRYPDREQRWLDALSRYEGACDALNGGDGSEHPTRL